MDLSITTTANDATRLVSVTGEVDVSNASKLREAVDEALGQAPSSVEVDLAETSYIDSTGIGVLVGAATRAADEGIDFTVANPQHNVRRVLGLLGVEKQLNVRD